MCDYIQNNVGLYNEEYTDNLLGPVSVEKRYLAWVERSPAYLLGKPTFHTFPYGLHEKQKLARP